MKKLLTAASVLCAVHLSGQAPYMVSDINTSFTPSAQSSNPRNFTPAGAAVYFSATGATTGSELFKTDGTTVQLVKDLRPGTSGSSPASFVDLGNGRIVFSAFDELRGRELWSSDGTEAGTDVIKDLVPGSASSNATPLINVGGKVFMLASGSGGQTVWVTDGQEAGTQSLTGVPAGPFRFAALGNILYFSSGDALWRSDGTPGGTSIVKSGIWPRSIFATADRLFLAAWDLSRGYELWTSDGTDAGTMILEDINPGAPGAFNTASPITMATVGSAVVFFANDGVHGMSLWRSDGTESGTVLYEELPELQPITSGPTVRSAAGVVFFALHGSLWRTDATSDGTFSLPEVSEPYAWFATPQAMYFTARDEVSGYGVWKSDGTEEGTTQIPGVKIAEVDPQLTHTGGRLYFSGWSGLTGIEPWTSDETAGGTVMLANLMTDPPASANPYDLRAAGSNVFFTANNGIAPSQLWRSDGTASGTLKLTQFPDTGYTGLNSVVPWNGAVFFRHSNELWRSDGTVAGTAFLAGHGVGDLFATTSYVYFTDFETNPVRGYRMWRTDGTQAGTIAVTPYFFSPPTMRGEIAGRFFFAVDGVLWRSDGTSASTMQISSIGYNTDSSATMGGALYYTYAASNVNYELWKNDGTPEGSKLVKEIRPGAVGSSPHHLTPAGALLFFIADDGTNGEELWRTDGTEAGTFLLRDIRAGSASSAPASLTAVDGMLYFAATNGVDGVELWKSDGTVAGTTLVADIAPGASSSDPQQLTGADGKLWFSATNAVFGTELWSTDGTGGGTAMVADLEPGTASSSPREMTAAGRRLYFSAGTSAGRELWALPLAASAFSITGGRVVEQDSGTQMLRFTVTRTGDLSQAATIAYATSNATATAGADYVAQNGSLAFAAGAGAAYIDVAVTGDDLREENEWFFVTLSAPSSGALERNVAAGIIEEDDRVSALSVALVHSAGSGNTRRIVVTNAGPSSATSVRLRYVESPGNPRFYHYDGSYGTQCSQDYGGSHCNVGILLPGESRTMTLAREIPYYGLYLDPANPPGMTATAVVSANEPDPDMTDNTVARMFSDNGVLMVPSFLVAGTTAPASFMWWYTPSDPTTVTLTSSNPLVVVSPPSVTIPRGETGASFALQVGNGTGRTILATGNGRDMSVPVVLPGQTPKLDVMIGGPSYSESYTYGEDFTIPANVLARTADDLLPTGRMQLLDASDQLLAEMTLGADGKASFPRSGLAPGVYRYKARYLGDPNFNSLTVDYPEFRIDGWSTYTTVVMPRVICGNSIEARVTVVTTSTTLPPTGQVELRVGNFVVLVDLTPTDEPGKSTAAAQLPAPTDTYVYATYVPTGTFDSSSGYAFPPAVGGCNPIGLTATATAVNRVSLSWSPTGAASYEIHRADGSTGFSFLGYATTNSYLDTQAQADRVYIYRVRPSGGALSEPDIAMTFFFADDPLVANVTVVKAQHLAQLATAVNFARATARLAAFTPAVAPAKNGVIRASHIQELRTVIAEARRFLGMLPPSWTDPALTVGTRIKAVHIQELRNALK